MRDGGRSSGIGLQGQVPNRLERHWSKARVVSVKEKAHVMRQVRIKKANTREPSFKCRNS